MWKTISKIYNRIPKELFSERFRGLSTDAKLLYGLLLDRNNLSIKNDRTDTYFYSTKRL
ncbi:replication initiator protein A [Bacillota bacterium LX-D]|nr:replication initiator protein A [Bacillota bacterium LX-D]